MRHFLGLDVGGTKTACVLADEHKVLGRAQSGSTKVLRVGKEEAVAHLREVLDGVSAESGVALADVTASCIGTSGAAISEVVQWLRQQMASRVGGALTILGDEVVTLDAAFPSEAGVVVIAGTGSNVIGRGRSGQMTGAGGWGPALADEGSGNLLGQQALRGVFAAINAGEEPMLLRRVLDYLGLRTRDELIAVANASNFSFAQLIPTVAQAARDGDRVAQAALDRGGEELAGLVLHVIRRLAAAEPGIEDGLRIACTGSIFKHVHEVSDAMQRVLLKTYPRLEFVPGTVDSLEGALWHARRLGSFEK
ncbi:BadF/BadG/BcrA/BcrD ATPase family protein [Edaphobacter bradus]|uniref:BadF/BadG/BcrA/BcrD ATPase family protein n=1 Tax=Edaphobacter bradus TaxID=2259016 RepID=UPI0021DF9306|nr:BadF/BadG/BcrA/BcrD ATPase family protein [Edaphobacter bradus]